LIVNLADCYYYASVATLRSSYCSLLCTCVAVYPERSEGSLTCASVILFNIVLTHERFCLFELKKKNHSGQRFCHYLARRDLNSFI